MKAVVVHSPGDIRWEEVPDSDIPEKWARVEIRAVGICSSDVPRALDGAAYHYPIVLGHEMAGVVTEVGEGADPSLIGKRAAKLKEIGTAARKELELVLQKKIFLKLEVETDPHWLDRLQR